MQIRFGVVVVMLAAGSMAQAQNKAIEAQFWMDAATSSLSMPGMSDDTMEGGLISQMMGGNAFGATKGPMGGMGPGKWLDTALWLRARPDGIEGTHGIPDDLRMGSTLPLLPPHVERGRPGREVDGGEVPEKPKGRILFYWGCGESVRKGQPRILDFAKADIAEYGRFMTGRHVPDRGAKNQPGRSVWPNDKDHRRVPKDGSLVGNHALSGDGVPASLKFAVGERYDFMPKIAMTARGDAAASVMVGWNDVSNAQGYFVNAMGAKGENEMIIWSSSEEPDPGWGLMTYLSAANVAKFLKEKVILPPGTQQCAIPQGIFAGAQGAMVNLIAYGPELNLSHPPRPPKAAPSWQPEWVARVRVKSTGMTMLGMGDEENPARKQRRGREEEGGGIGLPGAAGSVLRGIFGR